MKRNTVFFACSLLALAMLPGCSINASSSYYTVEVYADYAGMEQDLQDLGHYRTERSHRVAVGYALKDQKFLSDGLRSYKDNEGKGTLARSRKDSFYWYKKVIETNGEDLD